MKNLITTLLILSIPIISAAQSSLGSTDDLGRIAIAAVVPDESGITGGAQRMLQNKLMQIATQNGLGAVEEGSQFAMLPMVSVISQDVTPTAPPMVALNIEITLYIVDGESRNIFSQTTVPMRGVGRTEEAAYTQALRNLNPRHGQFRGFVETGKEKIVEFYNSQCDAIISRARALAGQQKYEEALAVLFEVPDVSRECYDKCMNYSTEVYADYSNQMCNEYLSAAKAAWAGKELTKVEENLGKITPDMDCYPQAQELAETVTAAVEAEGGNAWDFKMKKYDDSVDIEKMKIEAGKEVAKSWAYRGAAKHFDWYWLYPGAKPKTPEQPKADAQPEAQKAPEKPKEPETTAAAPSGQPKQHEPLENTTVFNKLSATVTAYHGDFKGNFTVLTDGKYSGTSSTVSWKGDDTYFIIDLGSVKQINGVTIGAIANNDVYLDWSVDGKNYYKFTHVLGAWGQISSWNRIEIYTTDPSSKNYEPRIKVTPVKARYLKLYSPKGATVSEILPLGL